jgi:hypothetical protein
MRKDVKIIVSLLTVIILLIFVYFAHGSYEKSVLLASKQLTAPSATNPCVDCEAPNTCVNGFCIDDNFTTLLLNAQHAAIGLYDALTINLSMVMQNVASYAAANDTAQTSTQIQSTVNAVNKNATKLIVSTLKKPNCTKKCGYLADIMNMPLNAQVPIVVTTTTQVGKIKVEYTTLESQLQVLLKYCTAFGNPQLATSVQELLTKLTNDVDKVHETGKALYHHFLP